MKTSIIPLNEAEGIFFPAFDKYLCKDEEIRAENASMERLWDSLVFRGGEDMSICWEGRVELGEYDSFLCFLSFPENVRASASAVVDGKEIQVFSGEQGSQVTVELKGSLPVRPEEEGIMTQLRISFCSELTSYAVMLSWLGLAISGKVQEMEKKLPVWKMEWDKEINGLICGAIRRNLVITEGEGERLRETVRQNKELSGFLRQKAEDGMGIAAEEVIREYVPVTPHKYRFARVRDRERPILEDAVLDLAVAGYLLEEPAYSHQSARLILALLAMKWYEGPVCGLQESQFHHVCFTEEHILSQIILAMGFLGGIFTEEATDRINSRIAEEWELVQEKCMEPGYRNYMNQGLAGNRGAILGALYLQLWRGGYEEAIEKIYERNEQLIDNYLTRSGHCAEGGGYFEYSFTASILLWHTYARYVGKDIREVVPDRFRKSADYLGILLSATDRTGKRIPINCASGAAFSTLLLAFMTSLGYFKEGNNYLIARFSEGGMQQAGDAFDMLLGLYYSDQINRKPQYMERRADCSDREAGLLCYRSGAGKLLVTAERNPYTGHFHEDRGGIVLEAEGEILLPDLGTANYADSASLLMDKKEYHNLACPADLKMRVASERGIYAAAQAAYPISEPLVREDMMTPEAQVLCSETEGNGYRFAVDTGMLYGEGITGIRRGRMEDESLYLTDQWELTEPKALLVTFLSYTPWLKNREAGTALSGRMKLTVQSHQSWIFETEEGMKDWEGRQVYILRIRTSPGRIHEINTKICWEPKKLRPEQTGRDNTIALQRMLDKGGTVKIEEAGVYEVEDTLYLSSHTRLCFGFGVIIKRASSSSGSFVFTNKGAFHKEYDTDITIEGLTLLTNGVEARTNAGIYGLTGELSFFYVKHLRIVDFTCLDLPRLSFGIHVCTFEDLYLEHLRIEGRKDAVHLGRGSGFIIRHGLFRTYDDPIALNAHDYAVANPQMGWIENGLIEDCYDLADTDTTGYFCRILAGAWCDWQEGMEIQNSDTVVSNGRVYRAFEKPDGRTCRSLTPPVHKEGMEVLDGIHWVMVQEEEIYQCGCRNIHFKNIHLQKQRDTALSIHFDHDIYSRSVYPGAKMPVQQNIVLEGLIMENRIPCLVRSITPIDTIKIINSLLADCEIRLESLPQEKEYPETRLLLMGNTFGAEGRSCLVCCEDNRSCLLMASGNLSLNASYNPCVSGKVRIALPENIFMGQ